MATTVKSEDPGSESGLKLSIIPTRIDWSEAEVEVEGAAEKVELGGAEEEIVEES